MKSSCIHKWLCAGVAVVQLGFASITVAFATGTQAITVTTLTLSSATASRNEAVKLRADVFSSGIPIAAGSVLFLDNGIALATVQVTGLSPAEGFSTGSAMLKRMFAAGSHRLTAQFLGDASFGKSVSNALPLTVDGSSPVGLTIDSDTELLSLIHFNVTSENIRPPSGPISLLNIATGKEIGSSTLTSSAVQSVDLIKNVAAGGIPAGLASGDFNGDGFIDVAVADPQESLVKIFLVDQDGWLPPTASLSLATGGQPSAVAAGDLNGDGDLDLVIVDATAGTLTIWFGDPDNPGNFVSLDGPMVLTQGLAGIVVADLNNDGILDIAVTNAIEGSVTILLGSPNDPGRFAKAQSIPISGGPVSIAVGDLYGDNLADLAVASYQSGEVWTLQNNPQVPGSFLIPDHVQKVGNGPSSVLIADVTGDHIPDIVVCDSLDNEISILPGISTQRGFFPTERLLEVGSGPVSLALIAATPSGMADLVVSNYADGTLEVLENDSTGTFQKHRIITAGQSSLQVAALDANGAPYPTLIALDASAGFIRIAQRQWLATGTFPAITPPVNGVALVVQAQTVEGTEQVLSNKVTLASGTAKPQTIRFQPATEATYGQPLALLATASSGLPVNFRVASGFATVVGTELIPSSIGLVTIEANQPGDEFFATAPIVSASIKVVPATLRVVAAPAQRMAGVPNPTLTGSMIGLVPGDPVQASFQSLADATTPAGVYGAAPNAIVPILHDPENRLANYTVLLSSAALTIVDSSTSVTETKPIGSGAPPAGAVPSSNPTAAPPPDSGTIPPASGSQNGGDGASNGSSNVGNSPLPVPVSPVQAGNGTSSGSTLVVTPLPSQPPASPGSPSTSAAGSGLSSVTSPTSVPPGTSAGSTSDSSSLPPISVHLPARIPGSTQDGKKSGTGWTPFPISLGVSIPNLPIHALFIPIPTFGGHVQGNKRTDLQFWISEGGGEPTFGETRLNVHFDLLGGHSPYGEVIILEQDKELAKVQVMGNASLQLRLHSLTPGVHTLSARYSGDTRFMSSIAQSIIVSVVQQVSTPNPGSTGISTPDVSTGMDSVQQPEPNNSPTYSTAVLQHPSFTVQSKNSPAFILTWPVLEPTFDPNSWTFSPKGNTKSYFSESSANDLVSSAAIRVKVARNHGRPPRSSQARRKRARKEPRSTARPQSARRHPTKKTSPGT